MPKPRTTLTLVVSPSYTHLDWVNVSLRKHWWVVGVGSRSRAIIETGFYRGSMNERELIESALRESLRAYCDELYKL